MRKRKRTYSFEQLANLVGNDMGIKEGKCHCDIDITQEGNEEPEYTFTFSKSKKCGIRGDSE